MVSHPQYLPSDLVRVRIGFGGDEPHGFEKQLERLEPNWHRLQTAHLCFNTFYPEVQGGYFLNRRLIALFQESAAAQDVFFCERELSRPDGVVPFVTPGNLLCDEEYVVWQSSRVAGAAVAWQYSVGGGGYYRDSFVLSVVGHPELVHKIRSSAAAGLGSLVRFIDEGVVTR